MGNLSERFFKGVTELGHMTDRHHCSSPSIIGYKSYSYYNIVCFLLGVAALVPMTDRHHYIYIYTRNHHVQSFSVLAEQSFLTAMCVWTAGGYLIFIDAVGLLHKRTY